MSEESNKQPAFTEEFRKSIIDFTNDLTHTFPEYSYLWNKWSNDTSDFDFQELFEKFLMEIIYLRRNFEALIAIFILRGSKTSSYSCRDNLSSSFAV